MRYGDFYKRTTGGKAKELVTVAVGSTILQEHAFARPDSASARCQLVVVETSPDVVPLAMTDSMISSATAAMLAALAWSDAAAVVVAVWTTVSVDIIRVVEVVMVVEAALVVMVLPHLSMEPRMKMATNH